VSQFELTSVACLALKGHYDGVITERYSVVMFAAGAMFGAGEHIAITERCVVVMSIQIIETCAAMMSIQITEPWIVIMFMWSVVALKRCTTRYGLVLTVLKQQMDYL
jgi:hypothetical protein